MKLELEETETIYIKDRYPNLNIQITRFMEFKIFSSYSRLLDFKYFIHFELHMTVILSNCQRILNMIFGIETLTINNGICKQNLSIKFTRKVYL